MNTNKLAWIAGILVLVGCSGGTSYEHGGTTEGTTGRGDYVSDGARKIDKGEYEEAIRLLTIAINHHPRRDDAHYHRALAKEQMGDIDGAIWDLGEAVRVNLHNAKAWFKRAWIYHHHKGNYRQAIKDYTMAIAERPEYADAFYHRGLTYQALKVFDSAVADIEKAIRVSPLGWSFKGEAHANLRICRLQANQRGFGEDPKPSNPR
jgi:tetratricopeptide (TPR) repeat protein